MVGLRWDWDYFLIFMLNMFVTMLVVENLSVAVSGITTDFISGLAILMGYTGIAMLIGGFGLKPGNIGWGWKWAYYTISYHSYSWQISMKNEFGNNNNIDKGIEGTGDGNTILKEYHIYHIDIAFNFCILTLMAFIYRFVFYLLLVWTSKK